MSGGAPGDRGPEGGAGARRAGQVSDQGHFRRLTIIWLIYMIISEPIIYFIVWPYIPPGVLTYSARGDQFDTLVAIMNANGGLSGLIIYGVYAIVHWRRRKGEPLTDGPALRSNLRVQFGWIFVTTCIVIGLFIFGTYELIVPFGAGGGEGPSPIWAPNGGKNVLPIQVIGQQWVWTYRYPTFGGLETTQLMIPADTAVAFHVTSLDVIHDWWAYQLGVKADANPGTDNVAFTKTSSNLGQVTVRCDELCGIWHGAMFNYGYVVPKATFEKWGLTMEKKLAPLTAMLPKFAWFYYPSENGAGADPPYYPSQDPFYQMYQYLHGQSGPEGKLPAVHVKNNPAGKAGGS